MSDTLRRAGDGRTLLSLSRSAIAWEAIHSRTLQSEWNNVIVSRHPGFGRDPIKVQIGRKLPLPDRTFDAAYALHIFEHHHGDEVVPALRELHRVMKPGATLRISTPDVETEARLYLEAVARLKAEPSEANEVAYQLAIARMIDQCVRSASGGIMAQIVSAGRWREEDMQTIYGHALDFLIGRNTERLPRHRDLRDVPFALWRRIEARLGRNHPAATGEYDALKPDEFLMRDALGAAGFSEIEVCAPDRSRIPGWEKWDFDRAPDGSLIEPGLYIEATRP